MKTPFARSVPALRVTALLAAAGWAPAAADTLQGKVVKVFDGDSFLFQGPGGGKPVEIRLKDIDAPESCQPGGPESRDFLQAYVADKTVTVETVGRDTYGRTLAVLTADGMNINQRMVAEGHAWSVRTKWNQGPLVSQEKMAQALKRGVHGSPGAVLPWDFRKSRGPCEGAAPAPAGSPAQPANPPAAPRPTPPLKIGAAPAILPTDTQAAYRCDGRTHCSQMTSCAEATYFLRNCPGTKMDGNNDGVPCEQQWCGR